MVSLTRTINKILALQCPEVRDSGVNDSKVRSREKRDLKSLRMLIIFKRILNFGEGHRGPRHFSITSQKIGFRLREHKKYNLLDLRFHGGLNQLHELSVAQSASLALGP